MASGLGDVVPSSTLSGLMAEDLRLLLNGCGDVSVDQLKKYTTFNDETGKGGMYLLFNFKMTAFSACDSVERLVQFKRWFWQVVENLSRKEKQDLVR